jgi:hypothetical protein
MIAMPTTNRSASTQSDSAPVKRTRNRTYTARDREMLRQLALMGRPWEHSTGPRTVEGKARVAENGRKRQKGDESVRQIRRNIAQVKSMIRAIASLDEVLGPRLKSGTSSSGEA